MVIGETQIYMFKEVSITLAMYGNISKYPYIL